MTISTSLAVKLDRSMRSSPLPAADAQRVDGALGQRLTASVLVVAEVALPTDRIVHVIDEPELDEQVLAPAVGGLGEHASDGARTMRSLFHWFSLARCTRTCGFFPVTI